MSISKTYKQIIIVFIYLLLFYLCTTFVFATDSTANNHIDAVLVIDTSNSMNGSDPKKIAVDGVKLFVDMLESSGSRVGVIGFNDKVTFKTGLKEINSFDDKQKLIDDIGKINYTGYTDIGLALKEAEKMLYSQTDKGNKPMIILFTDGYIETRGSRTVEQSTNEVNEVLLGAKNNYPIYTIGLNKSGRVDKDLIEKISEDTNALSYMTNNSEELPAIFNMIFADYIKSNILDVGTVNADGENYNNVDIDIPNNSVSEANIIMLSNNSIIDAKLVDPDGKEQKIGENNSIYFSTQGSYTMLKIIEPKQGKWQLMIKGIKGDQIKINLLYNYDISLKASMPSGTVLKKDTSIKLEGELLVNNQPLNDTNLMKDFNAELKVTDSTGKLIETLPMKNTGTAFTVDYTLPTTNTKLELQIDAAGAGFFRQSNIIDIEITNSPPEIIKEIDAQFFMNFPIVGNSKTINLTKYFKDEDDTIFNIRAVSDNNSINAQIDGDTLELITDKILMPASSIIQVTISDNSNSEINFKFKVNAFPVLSIILLIFIVIILIIILLKSKHNKKINSQLLVGYFEYRFTVDAIWKEQKQEPLYNYRGIVPLNRIIKDNEEHQMPELTQIFIKALKKDGEIMLAFENKSHYETTANFTTSKEIVLKFGETIIISNVLDNAELQITYLEDLFV